jgi:hypothetical protein
MRGISSAILPATAVAFALLFMGSPLKAGSYNFQTLNNPGDPAFNQLLGINNSATIGGYFGDGVVVPNNGYTLTLPSSYTAENFPGSVQTQVVGINNTGTPATTVGFYVDAAGNNFGFVNQGGVFKSITDPNTPTTGTTVNQLLGANDHGVAAGFYIDAVGNAHGYLVDYAAATPTFAAVNLPASFNAAAVTATGIDNAGQVSGFFTDAGGNTHGFIDIGGTFVKIDFPGGTNTMVLGLNNDDQVVGSYVDSSGETQGFTYDWTQNLYQTVSDPNASATPAFDVTGTTVNGINDWGQLVGFYSDISNVNGFLANPVPEPASVGLMFLAAALALSVSRLKKRA